MSRQDFKKFDISKAYFPVEAQLLFIRDENQMESYSALKSHRAIIDCENNHVFSVVTDSYNLILNKDAVENSEGLFTKVFKNIAFKDMQCFNVTMPKTRSFCHIDLIHSESDFEPWEKDAWTPFIRITNSYNKTKLLKYEIGFCRWICKNGMIFGDRSIEFAYTHSKNAKEKIAKMADNLGDIKQLEAQFINQLKSIKDVVFDKNLMFPLVLKVFEIKTDVTKGQLKEKLSKVERLLALRDHIEQLATHYCQESGENGYSALNVLTDFATRPTNVISPTSHINSYQTSCAQWLDEFTKEIKSKHFDPKVYLSEQLNIAAKIVTVASQLN